MDKYTVDLDQVLNDFEYSELTDQHLKSVPEKAQGSVSAPPTFVTKHSINNVFHSLNEYLNSGINSGSNGSALLSLENPSSVIINDNNVQEICSEMQQHQNVFDDSSNNSLGTANKNDQSAFEVLEHIPHIAKEVMTSNVALKEKTNEPISSPNEESTPLATCNVEKYSEDQFNNLTQNHGESELKNDTSEKTQGGTLKTEVQNYSLLETENVESITKMKSNNNNVDNVFECDKNVTDKADSALIDVESDIGGNESYFEPNLCEESVTKDNTVTNREDILVNIEENNVLSVNNKDNTENFVIEPSESPYAFGTDDMQEKPDVCQERDEKENVTATKEEEIANDNLIITSDGPSEEYIKDTLSNKCAIPEVIEEKNQLLNTENSDSKQTENILEDNNLTKNPISNPKDHIEESTEKQQVIGFSADLDIDESELHKMLEDLELEAEDFKMNVDIPVGDVLGKDEGDAATDQPYMGENDLADKVVENQETCLQMDCQVESVEINEHQSRGMTLDNSSKDKSSEKSPEPLDIKPQQEILECLEIKKPKYTKESPGSESVSGNSNCENVVTQDKPANNDKEQESISRPQNLPLNNELKDENVGRKINLIGSPGSTPYNNVYINKSIDPKTAHDTESDYTSSASPTFSDCSTDSSSTASTVSVEDVPNTADKLVKRAPRIKNTNVESESRESVQNQNITASVGEDSISNVQGEAPNNQADLQSMEASIPDEAAATVTESTRPDNGAGDTGVETSRSSGTFLDKSWLGREAPLWIPDADAPSCLHCDMKFTVLKRRHHCRACGLVLCSKCCNLKFRLEYLDAEARVCTKCYNILNKESPNNADADRNSPESGNSPAFRPNPNNPLEYCSTVSPLQQAGQPGAPPPSVMVPVGVLKRKGSNKKTNKSVMFCDGIAPGSDLTRLDQDFNYNNTDSKTQKPPPPKAAEEAKENEEAPPPPAAPPAVKVSRNLPKIDEETGCFIPKNETSLPPTISVNKVDIVYSDCSNSPSVVEMLKNEALTFAITQNLFVHVKVINMSCCINKLAWCFSTEGLINVGSDEVVYLLEYIDEESFVPKDIFFHIYSVFLNAVKGTSVKELGLSLHTTSNFLDSKNHAGFVYIKPSFQCLENVILPKEPYLIGILIHRWETPWAKLFPLRLVLRLGAEYRYYPSPLISSRHRESVFVEIGHTIINLLADFRNFTYTLPQIRGLIIHMEDKKTTITIPKNRYDQVMKSINISSEHILAFAGNFSPEADSHLVCIQDTQGHENCYTTHAINIHNKPRKITGASFIVFNGSLKSGSGLAAKSNIVEDGLMIQVFPEHMEKIRENLRNMKNHTIVCGCIDSTSDESVNIVWGENDTDFNAGVTSPIDNSNMKGVPSIRVHNGKDYFCNNATRLIRWTEVFILQNDDENQKNQDPVDISKVSESIAKACCTALVKYLDLLVSNSCQKIGVRATLHVENVSYLAGSNGVKLPPIYMRSLDDELVPVLHRITSNNLGDNAIVLELIFRILNA